ncbi:MAG: CopG family transcriptional regulator [Elusimicrobia bacterium RIFCSPLOWO2_01_FULL_60_11]|nr:MAG: CopG family transcriptional regulator [Elusimicrobia bacterium RIFCSPLOWO2_01_FULL_60_11]
MNKQTVTLRLDSKKKQALDTIATGLDRDRSYVLNEAIDSYLEAHHWQVEHIRKGIRQADAGHFAKDSEVSAAFAKWHR